MASRLLTSLSMAAKLFQRIVVPTDFSECAEKAWDLARRVAVTLGSEIVLIHVYIEPPVYGDPPAVDPAWRVYLETQKWVAEELERWAAPVREQGLTVRTGVRTGTPYQEIVAVATEEPADLVIMGTHGRGGMSRLLLGSVAERVIRFAPCPVLTVRESA
jgi:nucleotide-binding universal stress UspA family protein